jgi:hypothetical protein
MAKRIKVSIVNKDYKPEIGNPVTYKGKTVGRCIEVTPDKSVFEIEPEMASFFEKGETFSMGCRTGEP